MISGRRLKGKPDARNAEERDKAQGGNDEQRVGLGQIGYPQEAGATQFDGALNHGEEAEEDGDLQEHRQAAAQRADLVLAHELHRLLVHLDRVILVFLLDGVHLGLQGLQPLHRARARLGQRPEDEP